MANVRKFNIAQSGHLTKHYARGAKNYSNSDIDSNRTKQNYNLAPNRDQNKYLRSLLDNIKHLNRSNLIVMADWVIDLPKDLNPELQEVFFQKCYDFCVDRYGTIAGFENKETVVISSYVHLDETTPHMHFAFAPIKASAEGIQKFNCKEVICREDLSSFHSDLQNYLKENGIRCGIINGATKRNAYGRAYSVKELKQMRTLERERGIKRGRF